MKKVLVIACVAAMLLTIASVAMAGTETDWRILMRASSTTYTVANQLIQVGTRPLTTDGFDSGIGNDAKYVAGTSSSATVVSYRPEGFPDSPPFYRADFMAPIVAGQTKTWDLLVFTGTGWAQDAAVRLALWASEAQTPVATIGGVPYEYTVTVVNDRTGTYDAGTFWKYTPGAIGLSNNPAMFIDFAGGHLISTTDDQAVGKATVLRFTAAPVPEPGSMLALASGLVGMAGFAIRRRRA